MAPKPVDKGKGKNTAQYTTKASAVSSGPSTGPAASTSSKPSSEASSKPRYIRLAEGTGRTFRIGKVVGRLEYDIGKVDAVGTRGLQSCVGVYFEMKEKKLCFCAHINAFKLGGGYTPENLASIKNAVEHKLIEEATAWGWTKADVTSHFVASQRFADGRSSGAVKAAIESFLGKATIAKTGNHGFVVHPGTTEVKMMPIGENHVESKLTEYQAVWDKALVPDRNWWYVQGEGWGADERARSEKRYRLGDDLTVE